MELWVLPGNSKLFQHRKQKRNEDGEKRTEVCYAFSYRDFIRFWLRCRASLNEFWLTAEAKYVVFVYRNNTLKRIWLPLFEGHTACYTGRGIFKFFTRRTTGVLIRLARRVYPTRVLGCTGFPIAGHICISAWESCWIIFTGLCRGLSCVSLVLWSPPAPAAVLNQPYADASALPAAPAPNPPDVPALRLLR